MLADWIVARRESILLSWRSLADADPDLTTASTLSRTQFYDHIPGVLDGLERELRSGGGTEKAQAAIEQRESSADHGLLRWQQGYQLLEVMREWGHLHLCLVDELEVFTAEHPELDPGVLRRARRIVARVSSFGVTESTLQYTRLRQSEAAGRVRELERAMGQLKELERNRNELWREAAHDLRGNLGTVKLAAAVLDLETNPEQVRSRWVAMVKRGVDSLHVLLDDLISLSRLEAGQERRVVQTFDAAHVLQQLCVAVRALAEEKGLSLERDGPDVLTVDGDPVKVARIAQNLLLNAVHHTERGEVRLTWNRDVRADVDRWVLCVQDSGPGFEDRAVSSIAHALKAATDEAQAMERKEEQPADAIGQREPAPTLESQSPRRSVQPNGEGIGLSIVKRLCDLLDATIELETEPGKGSTFRVTFPLSYPKPV